MRIAARGPHVPDNSEEFLKTNPFVDIAAHKEGELIICPLLENFDSEWDSIPSISFLDSGKNYIQNH